MKRTLIFTVLAFLTLALAASSASAQQGTATAELEDPNGNPVGTATFTEGPEGVVIDVEVEQGVEPGEHGIHIHETGEIEPSFEAAGDHFNPTNAEHGFEDPNGPHAGDLENITVAQDGTASYQTVNDRITLGEGENSILDSDGSALVIHAMPDDYETNPSGSSGDRVAAGVIEAAGVTGEVPETGGFSPFTVAGLALLAVGALLVFLRTRRTDAS